MPKHLDVYGDCTGPFDFAMSSDEAKDLEKQIKDSPDEFEKFQIFSSFDKDIGRSFNPNERADISVIADDSLDEDNEVLCVKDMDWTKFRANPVVAFNHNTKLPPIGKSVWQKLIHDRFWRAKTIYAPRPEDFPVEKEWFPDSIFSMIKNGFLPGKSVGGLAKRRKPTDEEKASDSKFSKAKSVRYNAVVYEYSAVTRQANNNAIVESVSKSLLSIPEPYLECFKDMTDIYEAVKDHKNRNTIPVIGEYKTLKSYREEQEAKLRKDLLSVNEQAPEIMETALCRLLGRVC